MHNKIEFGIVQGRLSCPENNVIQCFPEKTWQYEFKYAHELGLIRIEWLFDNFRRLENPMFTDEGRKKITEQKSKYRIEVNSLSADYFRENPLKNLLKIKNTSLLSDFEKLLDSCSLIGIKTIMIPYVDYSRINNDRELHEVIEVLIYLSNLSGQHQINISLETNLEPHLYKYLLLQVNSRFLKVNYDSGDSASLGNDIEEEFEKLSEYFIQVHIKDRIKGGGTVPLGTGNVNFKKLFELIKKYRLNIPINLQTARELDPIKNTKKNLEFLKNFVYE